MGNSPTAREFIPHCREQTKFSTFSSKFWMRKRSKRGRTSSDVFSPTEVSTPARDQLTDARLICQAQHNSGRTVHAPRDTDVTMKLLFCSKITLLTLAIVLVPVALSFSASAPEDCLVLDDFASYSANNFPSGWTAREAPGKKVYTVVKEGETAYLRARAAGARSAGNGIETD